MKMRALIVCALMGLVGCTEPTIPMRKESELPSAAGQRFAVERVAVFQDELAYQNRRGVYIITDTETGEAWLGVSGVGVSELGRQSCGKNCTRQIER